jgi:UDP-glucose 4-epimerase
MVGATVPASPFASLEQEVELSLRPLAVLLDALADAPPALLVFPSSGGTVYGRTPARPVAEDAPLAPESAYGLAKAVGEEMVRFHGRRHGSPWLVLRLANPFGRRGAAQARQGVIDVFLQRLLDGRPVEVWGEGGQVRDYLLVDDAVEAVEALLAAGRRDETFNVGSGAGHSLREVMTALEEVSGRRLERRHRDDVYAGIPYNVLDTSALAAATGWRPRHDLRAGLAVAWRRAGGAP